MSPRRSLPRFFFLLSPRFFFSDSMLSVLSSLVRILISWTYLAAMVAVFAVPTLVVFPSRRLRILIFNAFGRIAGRVMIYFAGATLPPGIRQKMQAMHPAIFVLNHTSYLDIFLAVWAGPFGTVGTAKRETIWVPFFGQLYAISGHVRVNRDDRREAVTALRTLIGLVRQHGMGALLWPEGTRSPDGRLQPFKRGFVHLALATRLPVVPIVVSRAHHCWPKGSPFPRPATIDVQVLEPIATEQWTSERIDHQVAEVWERFVRALPDEQKPRSAGGSITDEARDLRKVRT